MYADNDTIGCNILFKGTAPVAWDRFEAVIGTDTFYLFAKDVPQGVTVFAGNNTWHYGVIEKEFISGKSQKLFVPRIYAGAIELYEHRYESWSTSRKSGTNQKYPFVNYYLAKRSSAEPGKLVLLRKFTKNAIAPWLSDQAGLLNEVPKKFDLTGLKSLLMQYDKTISTSRNDY